jgi:hypothetical protein
MASSLPLRSRLSVTQTTWLTCISEAEFGKVHLRSALRCFVQLPQPHSTFSLTGLASKQDAAWRSSSIAVAVRGSAGSLPMTCTMILLGHVLKISMLISLFHAPFPRSLDAPTCRLRSPPFISCCREYVPPFRMPQAQPLATRMWPLVPLQARPFIRFRRVPPVEL